MRILVTLLFIVSSLIVAVPAEAECTFHQYETIIRDSWGNLDCGSTSWDGCTYCDGDGSDGDSEECWTNGNRPCALQPAHPTEW